MARRKIKVPTYRKLTDNVSDTFNAMKKQLINMLKEHEYICLTADVWSSRAQSYLGVTVHILTTDFERKSFMLALRQIRTKQTYDVLAESISQVMADFEIDVDKVTNIVTDGGSAFCKAFKEFGVVVSRDTMEHELVNSNDCNDHFEDIGAVEHAPFFQFNDGEGFYSNSLNLVDYSNSIDQSDETNRASNLASASEDAEIFDIDDELHLFDSNELFEKEPANLKKYVLPQQRRCVSHILNLLSHDFEVKLNGAWKRYLWYRQQTYCSLCGCAVKEAPTRRLYAKKRLAPYYLFHA